MCIADIAAHHGKHGVLAELRRRRCIGRRGLTARDLLEIAADVSLVGRALRVDLDGLSQLQLPCILHWDLNHFVVLRKVHRRGLTVLDPAIGVRKLSLADASPHFTGVVLELSPSSEFAPRRPGRRISLSMLTGRVTGLGRSLLQILLVATVLEGFALVAPLYQQMVIDDAMASADLGLLTVLALGFGLLLIAQTLIGLVRSWMVISLSQTLSLQWASNVFTHLLKLPVDFFERRQMGDITSRFSAVQAIQKTLTTAAIEAVLDGVMALTALVMMLVYAPSLTAITIAAVATYGALRWAAYSPLRNASAERLMAAARENGHFLETLRAITPVKLFGSEQARRARWQNLMVEVQNRDVRVAKLATLFSSASTFVFGLEQIAVLWLGAKLAMGNAGVGSPFTVGMLFAFVGFRTQFTTRFAALINQAVELKMLGMHAERLADICLEPPEIDSVPLHDLAHLEPSIELRGISFRYSEAEPWILKDANLRVEAGESIAVVGPSGAGKTTLLKLALGLLKPTEGEVLFGGQRIQHVGLRNFRRQIGTVMQEDALLTGSLAENISFFDAEPDPRRIQACAQMAQLHDDISRMPMGYETLVGDLGSGLSGGQKQRLLLARALYRQPRVLALDEATSHLDVTNERAVTAAISHMRLTRLIIAHRPETIAGAQRVVQLTGGRLQVLGKLDPAGGACPTEAAEQVALA
jgi:ATP-binding cassette subfamily B protein RaxB